MKAHLSRSTRIGITISLTLCAPAGAWASSPSADVARVVREADRLLRSGSPEVAAELLKRARAERPAEEALAAALGASYLADDNPFWALNVLGEFVAEHPPACEARAWMAWIHLGQANLDQADEVLDISGCGSHAPIEARHLLLKALIARERGQTLAAAKWVRKARSVGHYYEEDEELLDALTARYEPHRVPPLSWDAEFGLGYTTNALSGAPIDEQSPDEAATPAGILGVHFRAIPPTGTWVTPTLDGRIRAQQFTRGASRDLSFRQLALRPGILIGAGRPSVELRYAAEAISLQGSDAYSSGAVWYSEAHRAEFELTASERFVAFGGAGYRSIRDRVRSRLEFDQGVAWAPELSLGIDVTFGASARWYRAREPAHTEVGATGLARLDWPLGSRFTLQETVSVSGDVYPYSEGYFPSAEGLPREDILVRSTTGLWWPEGTALRGAVEYTFTSRQSTAPSYEFDDHRALAYLRWSLDSDRLGTRVVPRAGRVPLETDSSRVRSRDRSAIQELMQRDEAVQRGSSCLK